MAEEFISLNGKKTPVKEEEFEFIGLKKPDLYKDPITKASDKVASPQGVAKTKTEIRALAKTLPPVADNIRPESLPIIGSQYGIPGIIAGTFLKRRLDPLYGNKQPDGSAGEVIGDYGKELLFNSTLPAAVMRLGQMSLMRGFPQFPGADLATKVKAGFASGLKNFPAVREGAIKQMTDQIMGRYQQPQSQIIREGAEAAGQNFDNLTEEVRGLMERMPRNQPAEISAFAETTPQKFEPELISLPEKPLSLPKPITFKSHSQATKDKMMADWKTANDKLTSDWQTEVARVKAENLKRTQQAKAQTKESSARVVDYRKGFERNREKAVQLGDDVLRRGDIWNPEVEKSIQYLSDTFGEKQVGGMLTQMQKELSTGGNLVDSPTYKKIASTVLSDLKHVQNAKLAAGSQFTDSLAINQLLDKSFVGGKINTKTMSKELDSEVLREAMQPESYLRMQYFLKSVQDLEKKTGMNRLLSIANNKLVWTGVGAAEMLGYHGAAAPAGGIVMTNSMLSKLMQNRETADLVVRALQTPRNAPEAGMLTQLIARGLQIGADVATVPER